MNLKELTKKKRLYVFIGIIFVGVLLWAFITASIITYGFDKSQNSKDESNRQKAEVEGVILTETKDEQKYWEIYGDSGNWDTKTGIAELSNVIGNFYKDNEVSMSLTSSKGSYNSTSREITLYKDTFIVLKDGITLKADKLRWIDSHTPIEAEGHIEIQKGKELISTADKIIISPTYDSFKIIGNTVSKIYEDKE